MKQHFTELDCGRGPTHGNGARLDHIFIGHQDGAVPARYRRREVQSDHSPLIAVSRRMQRYALCAPSVTSAKQSDSPRLDGYGLAAGRCAARRSVAGIY